jgi:hypothetical protein
MKRHARPMAEIRRRERWQLLFGGIAFAIVFWLVVVVLSVAG